MTSVSRRNFIATGALAAGALAFGPTFWRAALAGEPAVPGAGPYGPLGPPDANGISLPEGFRAREIARANQIVPGTAYPWHVYSDGQATYALTDGGWVLVSNSESLSATGAGSSAIRFDASGEVVDAYRILAGTNANCAGGRTPWGTWLSCEEFDGGQVWEADPLGQRPGLPRPAMGLFNHEAAAVDPVGKRVYMTEDEGDGCFYRFTPTEYPDLSSGELEVLVGAPGGPVTWAPVPDPSQITGGPTRDQVPGAARFSGGEGIWYDSGIVYFSTKGENRIYAYDTQAGVLEVMFDGKAHPAAGLTGLDNLCVSRSGDMFVCEDNGRPEYSIGVISREREVAHFLTVSGPNHSGSELAGVIFDPSGTRMYFASQRGYGLGVVYEVTGPFRGDPPAEAQPTTAGEPAPLAAGPVGHAPAPAPGPSAGSSSPAQTVDATLRVSAARRLSIATLMRSGVRVNVDVRSPATVTLALRTADLATGPGDRGSSDRPRTVTLARTRRRFARAGRYKVLLRPRGPMRRRLARSGSIVARYTVQAEREGGAVALVDRPVRLFARRSRG